MKIDGTRILITPSLILLLFFSAGALFSVSAQRPPQSQPGCPVVKVTCPDSVDVGGKLTFTVNVEGGDPSVTPTYNWTVSASSIESGQGTSAIEVNTGAIDGDTTVTATVDVGGFARSCATSASCTASIMKKAEARKLDEYGKIKAADENVRLDNFVIELTNDPTAGGYIVAYGGRIGRPGDAQKAADNAKAYLVKKRGVEAARVTAVNGGYREEAVIELWIVPSGAQPPQPTPSLDPSEVKRPAVKKPKAKKGKKS